METTKKTKFKKGDKYKARIPFDISKSMTVHIDHVLPSIYPNEKLIVYRVFGKHKRYWHQLICTDFQMEGYILSAEEYRKYE